MIAPYASDRYVNVSIIGSQTIIICPKIAPLRFAPHLSGCMKVGLGLRRTIARSMNHKTKCVVLHAIRGLIPFILISRSQESISTARLHSMSEGYETLDSDRVLNERAVTSTKAAYLT